MALSSKYIMLFASPASLVFKIENEGTFHYFTMQ